MSNTEPLQSCLPSAGSFDWTRALLHDSELDNCTDKMNNYFSTLVYDNTADGYGYDFGQKSDDVKFVGDLNCLNFYNKKNLISSHGSKHFHEENTEIDKLLSKFDTNVEDIWRGSSGSDTLQNIKYQTLFSQNFFGSPYVHYKSNLIWSFEQQTNGEKNFKMKPNETCCDSTIPHLNSFTSPIFQNSISCFDNMLNAFNATLTNIQKWSALEEINTSVSYPNQKLNDFSAIPTKEETNSYLRNDYKQSSAERNSNCNEEEDLLTSAKTHFRPIRAEEIGSSHTGTYADGTTFAISNDLEEVSFRRSESGLLYLEVDAETPRKYMEFKEKEGNANKSEWNCGTSFTEEFVPKFRLRQSNEKCVQTDQTDEIEDEQIVPAANDSDCESLSCKSDEDEFYFPGDNEIAKYIINANEEEIRKDKNAVKNDDFTGKNIDILEASLFHTRDLKSCVCGGEDWNQNFIEFPKEIEWSQIWNAQVTCDNCRLNSEKLSLKDRYRFREELTQEGEQLLLDLSCLQQIYSNSNWCDDDSNQVYDINQDEPQLLEDVIGVSEIGYPEKGACWSTFIAKEEHMKSGLDFRCLWKEKHFFSDLSRNEKKNRIGKEIERKRRNSSSQKACNLHPEGQCRRPHRFAHFGLAVGCLKNESCSLFRGGVRRPLSL